MFSYKKCAYLAGLLLSLPALTWAFDSFDCIGTEPAWKISITEHKFTFNQQTAPSVTLPAVEPQPAENMNMDHIRVFRTTMNNKAVTIIIQKQSCTDGSSEDLFAYEGLFIANDKVFHGCCIKKMLLTQ